MLDGIFDFTSNETNFCFFQKRTNKIDDIIIDGRIEENSLRLHYPIKFYNKIDILGEIRFGNQRKNIFDINSDINLNSLSKKSSCYGDILGFDFGWKSIKPNNYILLNHDNISNDVDYIFEIHNNISYKILELKSDIQYSWMVPVPNNMDKNYIKIVIYILNNNDVEGTINIKTRSESVKDGKIFNNDLDYTDNFIDLNKNSINIKKLGVLFINKENDNVFINNDLLLFNLYIDDFNKILKNSSLKLMYLKFEYDVNYLNQM